MKKKNTTAIALPIIAALFALVAIFCAMAPGFEEAARGTCFQIMFGSDDKNTNAVPGLIVVFIFEILIVLVSLVTAFNKTNSRVYLNLFTGLMALTNSMLLIFCRELYCNANPFVINSGATALEFGAGFIVSIIFNLLILIIAAVSIYLDKRKQD